MAENMRMIALFQIIHDVLDHAACQLSAAEARYNKSVVYERAMPIKIERSMEIMNVCMINADLHIPYNNVVLKKSRVDMVVRGCGIDFF